MSTRAVYDTMVFLQWAILPPDEPDRLYATITALERGTVRLCLSPACVQEIQRVLLYPQLTAKWKTLTPQHVASILSRARGYSDWFDNVPHRFTLSTHPKDDHLYNLAIAARADRFVTFENRHLEIDKRFPQEAALLKTLAPQLRIVDPPGLAAELRAEREQQQAAEVERKRDEALALEAAEQEEERRAELERER